MNYLAEDRLVQRVGHRDVDEGSSPAAQELSSIEHSERVRQRRLFVSNIQQGFWHV